MHSTREDIRFHRFLVPVFQSTEIGLRSITVIYIYGKLRHVRECPEFTEMGQACLSLLPPSGNQFPVYY